MKDRRISLLETLRKTKIVSVIRTHSDESLVPLMQALYRGGVRIIEITATSPHFEQRIAEIREAFADVPDCFVGAGTILTKDEVDLARNAGADFAVSPMFDEQIFGYCKESDLVTMPGCMTPSEVYHAWKSGADIVKAFPGLVCTPQWFSDMRGPLGMIPMMPTGNVNETTAPQYIKAGAVAVGVGKALASEQQIIGKDWAVIEQQAAHFVSLVAAG